MSKSLGKVVRIMFGTGEEGQLAFVETSLSEPSYGLRLEDGKPQTWAQSLTKAASQEEEVEYWKARAWHAEQKLKGKS